VRPYGWLSRYFHPDNTRRLLIEAGFDYHMDDYSSDVPFWDKATVPERPIVIVPYQLDNNDMKMWTDPAMSPEQWLAYAKRNFDQVYREGMEGNPKMMSLGLHLRIIGRPGRIWALEAFFRHVRAHEGVWLATRHEIAQHFRGVQPA
jgi:peptidoglycan/xylan/chitin deacetylase (PgdA/CDA1 family)